jgi:iron complex transport system ATP-binding protein
MLSVTDLTVTVGQWHLVDGASLAASGMTALVGPNGAGKSTLLKAIVGLLTPSRGSLGLDDLDLISMRRRDRARLVAYVEQSAATEERLTVRDVVGLGRIPFQTPFAAQGDADHEIIAQALDDVGLSDLRDRQFSTLSGGEQQRVQLARALAQQPRLLILDEPTSHLDIHAQMLVLDLLRSKARQGLTVLLALHDLNLATTYCDAISVMHQSRIVASGKPVEVLTPALLAAIYGVSVTLLEHPGNGRPVIVYEPRNSD